MKILKFVDDIECNRNCIFYNQFYNTRHDKSYLGCDLLDHGYGRGSWNCAYERGISAEGIYILEDSNDGQ